MDNITIDDSKEVSWWQNPFQSILNRPSPEKEAGVPESGIDLDINLNAPKLRKR